MQVENKFRFLLSLVMLAIICCWPLIRKQCLAHNNNNNSSNNNNNNRPRHLNNDSRGHYDGQLSTNSSSGSDAFQIGELISRLKNPNAPLALMTSSKNPNVREHVEACETYFDENNDLHLQHNVTIKDYALMALVAKMHSSVYSDAYSHYYENFDDLKLAAGPQVDQEQCLRQLSHLVDRARRQEEEKYDSKDLNMYRLLDTFGHLSSGVMVGNGFFEGMYHECLRLKIDLPGERPSVSKTRYCVASMKLSDWPKIDQHDLISFKFAVCLPIACDSLDYKNKYRLVLDLLMFQARDVEVDQIKLQSLYCLPDEDSPLRSVTRAPATLLTLVGLAGWLLLLAYATYRYEIVKTRRSSLPSSPVMPKSFGLSNGMHLGPRKESSAANKSDHQPELAGFQVRLFKLLSVTENVKSLLDTTKGSSLMEVGKRSATTEESNEQQQQQQQPAQTSTDAPPESRRPIVDLRCIEGIKVLAMCYIITGHVLMCISSVINNGRETSDNSSLSFCLANLVPAFAVNCFFTITAILTCYLMLKQNSTAQSFITSPLKWFAFIVYRYLRIMPMYALVVLYTKTLAKFAGSGPLWDYGTSSLAQRKACEQESWLWTLLFGSNFLPPLQHCIPSAWYLANDFQFFMITPIFLVLLHKRPTLGQWLIGLCSLVGYVAGIYSIWSSEIDDVRPIATFAPNGFKTYISHFSYNYTQPQYRIPAYLVGLLIGYRLYVYEREQLKYFSRELKRNQDDDNNNNNNNLTDDTYPSSAPDWSDSFKKYTNPCSMALITVCCLTPYIGSRLPFNKLGAKIMFSFIANTYHIGFSLSVGFYMLLATTGHGNKQLNRFLSAPFWKPLARLSLCAVLINVEVITYIMQTNTKLHYLSNQYQLSMNMLCILFTYVVSSVLCILFEAPIRGALNSLLFYLISKLAHKEKSKKFSQ